MTELCEGAKDRGKAVHHVDDDAEETLEEVEGFDDFTIASTWERFISEIEAVCRLWLVDGPKNLLDKGSECLSSRRKLYRIKCELKHGAKLYVMEYNFQIHSNDKIDLWDDDLQNLQLSFGVIEFLVIAPISASGVVLDAPEASKLLSAVAIALSNCGSNWPAFVPVHDPSRKAYIGIQNKCTIFTRRFDSDRIGSQVPVRLMHLEGLYELFVSKFALTAVDFSTNCFNVCSTMRLTYRTLCTDLDIESQDHINHESKGGTAEVTHIRTQWDDDCPWEKWYSAEDPVKGFELTAIWRTKMFEGSVEMAELENESPFDAETWLLLPIISQNMIDDSICKFGFFSQLNFLVGAFERSFEAKYVEDFVSAENAVPDISKSSDSIPPPTVVDRILKDLFHDGIENSSSIEFGSSSRFIKGAPLGSLFAQFCLHLLWLGNCNIRAIATMWIEFVREVRWCWEESQPLPKMPASSNIDLSACLVHQKLQMLSICIEKKNLLIHKRHSGIESEAASSAVKKVDLYDLSDHSHMVSKESLGDSSSQRPVVRHDSEDSLACSSTPPGLGTRSGVLQPTNENRRGSEGIVESMMLLHSFQNMHAPRIQDAPLMTEDMHEERLRAAEAFGNVLSFSGQLERDILSSDMSAFKAANPDAIFEDFIRWHSPGDWEGDEAGDESIHGMFESPNSSWPPKGKLSQRMAEHGSLWRKIWNTSPALAASEQRPLLEPTREGEKILHYLETLKPNQLLEQIVCTAFRASADTLSQTKFGDFRLLKVKIDQLYRTLASTLKLLANLETDELIRDLKQLCVLFEHIEKLIIIAASIHLKLSDAPRLSQAIFQEYFNFYLPKLGTGSKNLTYGKDFKLKQPVKAHERDVIASFFPPPTASQSWRKVLSMGNLLFGHEPTLREIIFSVRDDVSHGQYSSRAPMGDIETHRMYICGTSNDLRVALSVTSWD